MELKERVNELLRERGMNNKQLAEKIGWPAAQLCINLKSDNPRLSTLEVLARGLGIEVWELFIGREELEAERERRKSARLRQIVALTTICPCCGEPVCLRTLANVK